jgi:hypothetical protein
MRWKLSICWLCSASIPSIVASFARAAPTLAAARSQSASTLACTASNFAAASLRLASASPIAPLFWFKIGRVNPMPSAHLFSPASSW